MVVKRYAKVLGMALHSFPFQLYCQLCVSVKPIEVVNEEASEEDTGASIHYDQTV